MLATAMGVNPISKTGRLSAEPSQTFSVIAERSALSMAEPKIQRQIEFSVR